MLSIKGMNFLLVLASLQVGTIFAGRSPVKSLHSHEQFTRFMKHHKKNTGLPVVVDYYSDGCGPCRMMAPIYKRMAKEYKGRVAFAKVNVNRNHQTSSIMGIRSMPTFQFYVNGKKKHQFSGGDPNQLRRLTNAVNREARKYNIEVTKEALMEFYKEVDPKKTEADCEKVLQKYTVGYGQYKLREKLQKKYGKAPKKRRREPWKKPTKAKPSAKGKADKPNLQLASLEELQKEIEKRKQTASPDEEDEEEEEAFQPPQYKESAFTERVVIIGAGPAGLAAAVYAARAGLAPVIVAPPVGGQLMGKGVGVENYPGILKQTGPGIVDLMLRQASEFGTTFVQDLVTEVDFKSTPFAIKTQNVTLTSHSVILATGSVSRWLGIAGEHDLRGGGVSSCATCDGFLFAGQPVIVVGGGDTAMEDALVLARTSSNVTLIHRRDTFRASKILQERVLTHDSIKIMWNSTVQEFKGTDEKDADTGEIRTVLTHAVVRSVDETGEELVQNINAAGAFVAIGHDPSTKLYRGQIDLHENGYVAVKEGSTHTSIPGIFAAGDVADHVYRQAITSAGSGAMAALDAERYLSEHGIKDQREACIDSVMNEMSEEGSKSA